MQEFRCKTDSSISTSYLKHLHTSDFLALQIVMGNTNLLLGLGKEEIGALRCGNGMFECERYVYR